MKLISAVTFLSWPRKYDNPKFLQYQSDRKNFLLGNSLKIGCSNLYLHPKFQVILKPNSYLISISCRDPVIFLPHISQYHSDTKSDIFTCC